MKLLREMWVELTDHDDHWLHLAQRTLVGIVVVITVVSIIAFTQGVTMREWRASGAVIPNVAYAAVWIALGVVFIAGGISIWRGLRRP